MEDVFAVVQQDWAARGCGSGVGTSRLTHICWADDTWLLANSAEELGWMIGSLEAAARRVAGLELQLANCTWARIQRRGVDMPELRPTEGAANLRRMAELPQGKCLGNLGAFVQVDVGRQAEVAEIARTAWEAFQARQVLWRAPGHLTQKLRVLHMTVCASMSWASGTRQ